MKKKVKNLEHYPVTVTSGVFLDNSSKTLQEAIDDGTLTDDLKQYSSKLITYKGEFDTSLKAGDFAAGDFWIYKGDSCTVNSCIAFYNDIIYVQPTKVNVYVNAVGYEAGDGKVFKSIHRRQPCNIAPKEKSKYDVIVVGAGAGGIGAAYALRNSGYRVALIERNDTLGGTHCHTTGLLIASPVGNWFKDICKQMYDEGYMEFYKYNAKPCLVGTGTYFDRAWRGSFFIDTKNIINNYQGNHINVNGVRFGKKYQADLEGSIDIFTNRDVFKVYSEEGKIYEIVARNLDKGGEEHFIADWFIDCSADGVLATKNDDLVWGTDYYSGTDGRARFNETAYGQAEEPDIYAINTVEPCVYTYGQSIARGLEYIGDWKLKEYPEITGPRANYTWNPPKGNISVTSGSYGSKMILKDFLTKSNEYNLADGYDRAKYMMHTRYKIAPFESSGRFVGCPKMLAIRESFRYACEKTVDQNYLMTKITSDNIESEQSMALSTWYVDIHNQSYSCTSNIVNGVPYKAMIPKCYNNVLVASRCYGASHLGLSSIRLVKSMLDLGYSAGKAMIDILENGRANVREADTVAIQNATGIKNSIAEVETYFYGSTVDYIEANEEDLV